MDMVVCSFGSEIQVNGRLADAVLCVPGVWITQVGSPEWISPGLEAAVAEPFMALTFADRSDTGPLPS
ncbi:hypothetical protein [Nonomuraea roseola]|uniref:Uncharacterized protein n=1 Tax=Nonomuraea roseola TaxID=46179 RepID=A0ABV5PPL2_9ACTN